MPLAVSDIEFWCSVNNPENDSSTSGGAIQDSAHASGGILALLTDIAATDTVEVLSDGADTRTVTVTGRSATGAIVSEPLVLNGATPVNGAVSFERILKVVLSAKSATRTVTVRRATGDTLIVSMGINTLQARRLFYDSASDPAATRTRYELIYLKNKSVTNALTNGSVILSADPGGVIEMGISQTVHTDEASVANRFTAPAGITFVDTTSQAIPGGGTLDIGQRCGLWLKQVLDPGEPALDSTVSVKVSGSST